MPAFGGCEVRRRPWSLVSSERALQRVVARDVALQVERCRALMGRDPTASTRISIAIARRLSRPIFLSLARELEVPLRHYDARIRFSGEFYSHDGFGRPKPDAITTAAPVSLLAGVPAGVTKLCSHPGHTEGLTTPPMMKRRNTLCTARGRPRRLTSSSSTTSVIEAPDGWDETLLQAVL
jgi:hypothetical protein